VGCIAPPSLQLPLCIPDRSCTASAAVLLHPLPLLLLILLPVAKPQLYLLQMLLFSCKV
jgi:hypothetical protein